MVITGIEGLSFGPLAITRFWPNSSDHVVISAVLSKEALQNQKPIDQRLKLYQAIVTPTTQQVIGAVQNTSVSVLSLAMAFNLTLKEACLPSLARSHGGIIIVDALESFQEFPSIVISLNAHVKK